MSTFVYYINDILYDSKGKISLKTKFYMLNYGKKEG